MRRSATLASAVALFVLVACSAKSTTTSDQQKSIARAAALPDEVANVFGLAAKGADATYTETIMTKASDGSDLQITTAQRPPERRVDVFHADGSIDSTIVTGGVSYQCTMTAGAWKCGRLSSAPSTGGVLGNDTVSKAIDQFKQRATDYDFRFEARTIAGTPARCVVTTLKAGRATSSSLGQTGTLCLSNDGVPLLIDVPSGTVQASSYATTVKDGTFTLPAPPDQTAPSASSSATS